MKMTYEDFEKIITAKDKKGKAGIVFKESYGNKIYNSYIETYDLRHEVKSLYEALVKFEADNA